jgi:hypothetical protein
MEESTKRLIYHRDNVMSAIGILVAFVQPKMMHVRLFVTCVCGFGHPYPCHVSISNQPLIKGGDFRKLAARSD